MPPSGAPRYEGLEPIVISVSPRVAKIENIIVPVIFCLGFAAYIIFSIGIIDIFTPILILCAIFLLFRIFFNKKIIYTPENKSMDFIGLFGKRSISLKDIFSFKVETVGTADGQETFLRLFDDDAKVFYSYNIGLLNEDEINRVFSKVLRIPQAS